jgi:hypothetical protein
MTVAAGRARSDEIVRERLADFLGKRQLRPLAAFAT